MARFWAKFVDEKIIPTEKRFWCAIEEEKEKIKEEFHYHVHKLEEQLKDKEYFHGKEVGYLDIVVVFMGHWFQVQSQVTKIEFISEHKHPILSKWIEKLHRHEHVHSCFPPTEKHVAFYKAHFESSEKFGFNH
ncbi:glutathione S-transferase TAU 8 [Euphorbia peplus]|nr:glutathione S-transferase TAU 8 [Euphorbia peplus]